MIFMNNSKRRTHQPHVIQVGGGSIGDQTTASSPSSTTTTTTTLANAFAFLVVLYVGTTLVAVTFMPSISSSVVRDIFFFSTSSSQHAGGRITPFLRNKSQSAIKSSITTPLSIIARQRQSRLQTIIQNADTNKLQTTFPIHTQHDDDNDMESIDHPGILFAGKERLEALLSPEEFSKFPTTIKVPKFWNPKLHNSSQGSREYLGNSGQQLITLDEALSIGSYTEVKQQQQSSSEQSQQEDQQPSMWKETIYISVASYRDPECSKTIESIYERATYPDRIRVGIVDQIDTSDDSDDPKCNVPSSGISCESNPNQTLCRFLHLIDRYEMSAEISVGPVLARHIAHRMYRGEYFVLQIDAHVQFIQDWDTDIVRQWYATNNEMAVITTYLTDITNSIDPITHKSKRQTRNIMCNIQYECTKNNAHNNNNKNGNDNGYTNEDAPNDDDCFLVLQSPTNSVPQNKTSPMLHPFYSAGFVFSRGHFIIQVPYDQYLPMLFHGEESNIAIRGFTYGYDYYAPLSSVAFHIYAIKSNIGRRNRHKYWEHETLYQGSLDISKRRLNAILAGGGSADTTTTTTTTTITTNNSVSYIDIENDKYGIGHVRDRSTYYKTFGINPRTKTTVPKQELCGVVQNKMHIQFTSHIRNDGMGVDYSKIETKLAVQ